MYFEIRNGKSFYKNSGVLNTMYSYTVKREFNFRNEFLGCI